jgi:histidinol phosphatase-like PHP family hydrolase
MKTNVQWDKDTYLDFSLLYNCHSNRDTVETIDTMDMKEFVECCIKNIKILIMKHLKYFESNDEKQEKIFCLYS